MPNKKRVVNQALHAALESWSFSDRGGDAFNEQEWQQQSSELAVETDFSATLFSGEAQDWVPYLKLEPSARYEPAIGVSLHLQPELRTIAFEPENEGSQWLAELLRQGVRNLRRRVEHKPHVLAALDELIFSNQDNATSTLGVRLSPLVPSYGTRESGRLAAGYPVRLVLNSRLTHHVRDLLSAGSLRSGDERLGWSWPLIAHFISLLAYPNAPLDRFAAKIDVFSKLTYVALNALYETRKGGQLVPSVTGDVYARMIAESLRIPADRLPERHPYFRMLSKVGFVLRAQPYSSYADEVRVAGREYLDGVYLRLSLAGAMPELAPGMRPMSFVRTGRKVRTEEPAIGSHGVVDADDLEAWKEVARPFRDLGFMLLRQLGMGEFGRVYEALNTENPQFPAFVALKIDRIVGKKKNAILEAEAAMIVGRELARAPHLIRLYDTGKLRGQRFTYHVLQLIDGDTLDNLVGVTGTEHASVSRPPGGPRSEGEAEAEYERAVSSRGGELWRRRRMALPFKHELSPTMVLDLLSSVLLWLEDVHRLGYAINDLKNGNLMMSRRGQLKGIDLDSYAPVHSPKDKITDFMFLAVSLVLLLFSAPVARRGGLLPWEALIESERSLRAGLDEAWPFGDVDALSEGRVSRAELTSALVDLVHRSRHLVYTKQEALFSQDVARVIELKHRLLLEEMVID